MPKSFLPSSLSSLYVSRLSSLSHNGLDRVAVLLGEPVMLLDVDGLPGVADPLVSDGAGGQITSGSDHVVGENTLLLLILVLHGTGKSV